MTVIKKAKNTDVVKIKSLLHQYVQKGIILDRSENEIIEELDRFYIAEKNGIVTGTVSYHDYGSSLKEIRSLVVNEANQKSGTGKLLIKKVISDILTNNSDAKIFTLTYVPEFFKRLNFHVVDKDTLPEKIWKDCNNCDHKDSCGETALVYSRDL